MLCLCTAVIGTQAQSKMISGKVTDERGIPIPLATVQLKGQKSAVLSSDSGTFSITVPQNVQALVISSIGYAPLEVSTAASSFNISLKPANTTLSEVVVVGYGVQRKNDQTGNLAVVKGAAIADKPVQTFDQALAGRAAGVQITVPNGVLNSPPVFRIRGTNSISLSSYPLVVVDGVPSFTGDYSSTAAAGNALASINPNDIESIDIAKDAAATAIYGSRAANGVVFITTKKGKSGKARVNYNGWVSWNEPFRLPEVLNADEYTAFKNAAADNNPTATSIEYIQTTDSNGNPINTNWSDNVYRTGFSHSHNVNVSGGTEGTTYYFSAGYTNQEGILQKNDFKRINTLFNIDSRINNIFTVGGKISYSNEHNLAANTSGSLNGSAFNTGGLGRLSFVLPPIIAPYNNDGSYNINGAAIGSADNIKGISNLGYYNPVPILDLNYSNSENNRIQSNAYLQVKPINDLTIKTIYGIDYLLIDNNIFWTPLTGDGYSYGGYAWSGASKYKTWVWTTTIQYDKKFGDHTINALVGNEQQRTTSSGYGLQRQTLSDDAYDVIQAGYTTNNPANLVMGENYLLSNFGRLNYNYKNRYYIAGNIRQDEYSALGTKKGLFYGFSAGWDISNEDFWNNSGLKNTISSFKIRGSYGKVGNVGGVGDYSPYSLFASGLYGGQSTLVFNSVGNPELQWETSKKLDFGFTFGLFNNRLSGEFSYYNNDIDGLILAVQQAPSTGLPNSPNENVGSMYNKGVEITLNANPVNNHDFSWNTSFNITFNNNEVTSLTPTLPFITTSTSGLETANRTEAGYSLGQLWVVRTGGVDAETGKRIFIDADGIPVYYQYYAPAGTYNYSTTADGTTRYVNKTGGTSITQAADAVMYANTQPKIFGGWDNTFHYKNFDLNLMFTYQSGFYVYYGSNAGLHDQRWWNNARDVLTDAWEQAGDANKIYARPVYGDNVSNGSSMPLDINVFKGDFIKFKNLSLGYTLPANTFSAAKISNLRIYASVQNLAIITQYPGPDPEVSSNGNSNTAFGVDRNTAANARTFILGLNVSF